MKNDLQLVPHGKEMMSESLLLVNRKIYRARFVTSQAIHLGEPGEWTIELKEEGVLVTFPKGRILDQQNRPWVTELLRVSPADIYIPFGHPMFVSSLGPCPRYHVQFPGACSLTIESAVPVDALLS